MRFLVSLLGALLPLMVRGEGESVDWDEQALQLDAQLAYASSIHVVVKTERGRDLLQYIDGWPRPYTLVVLFAKHPSPRTCPNCYRAFSEFVLLAEAFKHAEETNKSRHTPHIYFMFLEMTEREMASFKNSFPEIKLPCVMLFPADRSSQGDDYLDMHSRLRAETVARWLHFKIGVNIQIIRGWDREQLFLLLLPVVVYLYPLTTASLKPSNMKDIAAAVAVFFCAIGTSGQFLNYINGAKLLVPQDAYDARIEQMLTHSFMVLNCNLGFAVAMILLIESVGGVVSSAPSRGRRRYNRMRAILCLLLLNLFFSWTVSISGYSEPYRLLFSNKIV